MSLDTTSAPERTPLPLGLLVAGSLVGFGVTSLLWLVA